MRWVHQHVARRARSARSADRKPDAEVWSLEAIGRHGGLAVTSDGILYARPSLHRRTDEPQFIAYDDIVAVEAARGFTAHSGKLLIYHHGGECTQVTGIRSSTVHQLAAMIDGQLSSGQRAG
jgi:hypothetical protein